MKATLEQYVETADFVRGEILDIEDYFDLGLMIRDEGLDRDAIQALIEHRRTWGDTLRLAWAGEEVPSSCGYPDGWALKDALAQAEVLKRYFPELDVTYVEELAARITTIPTGMDGIGVIPKLTSVRPLKNLKSWDPLNLAMVCLIDIMHKVDRNFSRFTVENIGPKRLRLHRVTARAYAVLEEQMPGDVLVLPVQTGILHRGKSGRRARVCMKPREFGLCSFAFGCILLSHPERLQRSDSLWAFCPGAEFSSDSGNNFSCMPSWGRRIDELEFGRFYAGLHAHPCWGSASAVLPE